MIIRVKVEVGYDWQRLSIRTPENMFDMPIGYVYVTREVIDFSNRYNDSGLEELICILEKYNAFKDEYDLWSMFWIKTDLPMGRIDAHHRKKGIANPRFATHCKIGSYYRNEVVTENAIYDFIAYQWNDDIFLEDIKARLVTKDLIETNNAKVMRYLNRVEFDLQRDKRAYLKKLGYQNEGFGVPQPPIILPKNTDVKIFEDIQYYQSNWETIHSEISFKLLRLIAENGGMRFSVYGRSDEDTWGTLGIGHVNLVEKFKQA